MISRKQSCSFDNYSIVSSTLQILHYIQNIYLRYTIYIVKDQNTKQSELAPPPPATTLKCYLHIKASLTMIQYNNIWSWNDYFLDRKFICNNLDFFAGSSLLNVKISCFNLSYMIVNFISLGFKHHIRHLWWTFFTSFWHFINQTISGEIVNAGLLVVYFYIVVLRLLLNYWIRIRLPPLSESENVKRTKRIRVYCSVMPNSDVVHLNIHTLCPY